MNIIILTSVVIIISIILYKFRNHVKRRYHKNGKINGILKHYYESGQLKSECQCVNYKKHGIRKWYYESGQLKSETPYVNNEKHGIMKQYYKSGELKEEFRYVDGELIGTNNYDETGNIIK